MFLNEPNLQDLELFTCKITSTALVIQERAFQLSPRDSRHPRAGASQLFLYSIQLPKAETLLKSLNNCGHLGIGLSNCPPRAVNIRS
jgi:hypothetical protein